MFKKFLSKLTKSKKSQGTDFLKELTGEEFLNGEECVAWIKKEKYKINATKMEDGDGAQYVVLFLTPKRKGNRKSLTIKVRTPHRLW